MIPLGFLTPSYYFFFPLTALGYFLLPRRAKALWLLGCSWFFYLCAGPQYFPFLLGTVLVTYFSALALEKRAIPLAPVLCLFVGVLFLFKYLDFGASLLIRAVAAAGLDWSPAVPRLLLPAGISFYLFAAMGYLIDVHRGKYPAERSFILCALFLSFFPALLSGPIGRGDKLLPQFRTPHPFLWDDLTQGGIRFLWGAFKKLVLADRLAILADTVFASPGEYGSAQVLAACLAFSLQIYCDFSAYSDMALGSARAMGFTLTDNFRTPYFSRTVGEFWRRWHISLSSWFRDYLYIPLGGNRKGTFRKYLNLLIVFAVSGLWHGAALSFLVWGLLNGVYQVAGAVTAPLRESLRNRVGLTPDRPLTGLWQSFWVFALSTFAWVFFKAGSVSAALGVLGRLTAPVLWVPLSVGLDRWECLVAALGVVLLTLWDLRSLRGDPAGELSGGPRAVRWAVCLFLLLSCLIFGIYGTGYDAQSFIYGQF